MMSPLQSLNSCHWFKLICGASYQHLPSIRNLVLAYGLAGADCIDVAADLAVIQSTRAALDIAATLAPLARSHGFPTSKPWLMISVNDGEDPHFRKAVFDANSCPSECPRPCAAVCPTNAIPMVPSTVTQPQTHGSLDFTGVIGDRCYGCGRCLSVCPEQQITTTSHQLPLFAIAPTLFQLAIDAIEIHTQIGRLSEFQRLWHGISPWINQFKLVAVSCPDGEGFIDYLQSLIQVMNPLPNQLLWQTDGRPMSGDIGDGTTHAAIRLGQKVLAAGLPGYVQLAGGTNHYTVPKLRTMGLLPPLPSTSIQPNIGQKLSEVTPWISGVAYGSYARVLLSPVLDELASREDERYSYPLSSIPMTTSVGKEITATPSVIAQGGGRFPRLEAYPDLLWKSVRLAYSLINQLK